MGRITRRHKIIRILILIGAAIVWMGPPRPPMPPGCRGPRPPMPYQQAPPASFDALR